jgi:hypothetical protein
MREHRRQVAKLYADLRALGFLLRGTVNRRYTRCGTPGCGCRTNPSARHGPYYDWTRKVGGKTVTVRLTAAQAKVVGEWIARIRRFDRIAEEIQAVSAEAVQLVDE